MRKTLKTIPLVLSLLATTFAAQADVFDEIGDAGSNLPTANFTTGGGIPQGNPITAINGSFLTSGDADVFAIYISNPAAFSATTINGITGSLDTQLFLFTATGAPVLMNDDANGTSLGSTITGNSGISFGAGYYYLAISLSGNDPVNSVNQLLFATSADTTAIRGPAFGVNPPLFGFSDSGAFGSGNYQIILTGVSAIPEPSVTLFGLAASALGTGCWLRRRKSPVA